MKAEDPMAMMREAHRELSASYQQVAANKKPSARPCRWFCMKFVQLEVSEMNYSDVAEMGKDARERLFPVGIMLGFPFDPNRADDMPGEWERVSTIWRRVK